MRKVHFSGSIKLFPEPEQYITKVDDSTTWQIGVGAARFELIPSQYPIPSGWVLFKGVLHRRGHDFSARLFVEVGDKPVLIEIFPVPVTRKGTILELYYLPKNVTRLELEPMRSPGECDLGELTLTAVGQIERIARMWRRVIPMFFNQPAARRRQAGFSLSTPLLDLQYAYQIAGRFRSFSPELSYDQWLERFDALTSDERSMIRQKAKRCSGQPLIEILVLSFDADIDGLKRTIESLRNQLYCLVRIHILVSPHAGYDDKSLQFGSGIDIYSTDNGSHWVSANRGSLEADPSAWYLTIESGAVLAESACYWFAWEIVHNANLRLLYSDHDHLDETLRRIDPMFKPDWSAELLRSTNYIGSLAVVRADTFAQAGGFCCGESQALSCHDFLLRVVEQIVPSSIAHIPAILWHLPLERLEQPDTPIASGSNPVASHLLRTGVSATVNPLPGGHFRVKYALPSPPPLVSIIVPTRDALSHLQACVESLLATSSYDRFELIIVDNLSIDPQTLAYLDALLLRPQVRVLRYAEPFNYSAINNFAAQAATGEILCLLNNDTEIITPDWMEEMLGRLLQPGVGVVGAKLFFSDGRVQHAGDTVGPGGCADHLHTLLERDAPGYCNRAMLAQDLSAVTAACLMTHRSLFLELGGLDERHLPVSFNDVDYCLRVREAGYRVIWTPYAQLYHHESVTRGKDDDPLKRKRARSEANYMRRRWRQVMQHDPFYNPNLSYARPDFSLSNSPLVKKPW